MAMKVGQLDLSGWPLINVVLDSRSTPPLDPDIGRIYFDLNDNRHKYWTPEGWKTILTQDDVQTAIDEVATALAAVDEKVGSILGPSPVLIFENGLV